MDDQNYIFYMDDKVYKLHLKVHPLIPEAYTISILGMEENIIVDHYVRPKVKDNWKKKSLDRELAVSILQWIIPHYFKRFDKIIVPPDNTQETLRLLYA